MSTTGTDDESIEVWSTNAFQAILRSLAPDFERASARRLSIAYRSSAMIMEAIAQGGRADAVIATRRALDALAEQGIVAARGMRNLASTGVGVAVRAGARKPDIGSADALRRALLEAKSVAYSATGMSAVHFMQIIERLGIAEPVKAKAIVHAGGLVGEVIARDDAELGVQMVSELLAVPGVELAGPLPPELQTPTMFAGGVFTGARHAQAALALIELLAQPEAARLYSANGMEPAYSRPGLQGVTPA